MKDQFLKLAGAKNEKEFYKLFPTEKDFMAKYGKQVRKLNVGDSLGKLAGSNTFAAGIQSAGDIVGGIQQMKDEKEKLAAAQQMKGVSDISLQASLSKPEQVQRRYVRPEDNINTGEAFFPVFGAGTTLAKNGGEIANTFAPNTIYTDLDKAQGGFTFPKINTNPEFMKQATGKNAKPGDVSDIFDFAEQGGGEMLTNMTAGLGSPAGYGQSGAGKVGKGIGTAAGSIFFGPIGGMVGGAVGQLAGNLLDRKAEKTEAANESTQANIDKMVLGQGAQALQQQNYSYMEYGGMINPQVATSLEGIPLTKLFAPDPYMDTLRTGGNIRQNQMAMGGNLKTHWGGGAESISYNPYLPDNGETVMFKGQSHDESDGKGNTGIGITYGNNPVEVERGEPAVQLRDGSGGNNNLTVYGNLKIPSFGAQMLGDPKASGKKFKNYVSDLSKVEQKQNNLMSKSVTALDDLDVTNSFDKLSFDSYKANMLGANMKLKDIADKKIKASSLQSAINDTAEEYSLIADDLAKGKVKQAKMGAKLSIAKDGVITKEERNKAKQLYESGDTEGFQKYAEEIAPDFVKDIIRTQGVPRAGKFTDDLKGPRTEEVYKRIMNPLGYEVPGSRLPQRKPGLELPTNIPGVSTERSGEASSKSTGTSEEGFDWMTMANQVLPYLRPTDAESLDPRQLAGEMYALSTNQVEPVRAQTLQPELSTPYDISLQDQINANQTDYRAAQRMVGYNPAAQGMLNAQKYQANQQVLGEQFRMNQAMKDRVYAENRNLINQSNLQNLGILDQQYGRQQEALSKTKATTQAALNSISSKYAQNQLENRQLQTYENMYNYRFDDRFRAMNMNPLAQFNMEGSGTSTTPFGNMSPEEIELYAKQLKVAQNKQKEMSKSKDSARNGTLVKANK